MAVKLIAAGGLMTRAGHLAGRLNDLAAVQGGNSTAAVSNTAQLTTGYNLFQTDFASSPIFTNLLDGLYNSYVVSGQNSLQSVKTQLNSVANQILQQQVNLDTPLSQINTPNALQVLCSQMTGLYYVVTSGASAGAQTSVGTPMGNPEVLVGLTRGDGLSLEYVLPETLTITCTKDQNSGATVNQETFSVIGQNSAQSSLSYNWPLGSGVSTTIQNVDATASASGNNLLYNSDFQIVTNANIPDNWIKLTGTIGTTILAAATGGYTNGVLQFVGTGSENTAVYQQFNATPSTTLGAGGTTTSLAERAVIAFNGWYKMSATPAAGVLQISLCNSTTGAVLNNDAGIAQSLNFSLTGLSTTFVNFNGFFQVPTNLPASGAYYIRVKLSTALDNAKTLTMCHFALSVMNQLYQYAGPFITACSSNTPPVVGDSWTVAVSTNMGPGTWQGVASRFWQIQNSFGNYPGLSLRLPTVSSGGETIINAALIG